MGVGPILLFDKSTLESLSVDEAVWLDTHYRPNITPLFFVETLADLEKEVGRGRTPEQVVGNLAEKTPTGSPPNVYHLTLCLGELLGNPIEMRRLPAIRGGRRVMSGERRGIVFEQPPEFVALQRWEQGKFLDVERDFARGWRQALSDLDLDGLYRKGRAVIERLGRPRDLSEVKSMAVAILAKLGSNKMADALQTLGVDKRAHQEIVERWRAKGKAPFAPLAPYTAHVLTVDTFFCIALGADLISRDRPSNKIDIAYLYYLPFCMAFASSDKLHAKTARLFIKEDQVFIWGPELKADLAKLDAHYSAFPEEVKERGIMSFAYYPPSEGDFLVSRLWDKMMRPGWRQNAKRPREPLSEESRKRLVEASRQITDAPTAEGPEAQFGSKEADAVVFTLKVPIRRGKWRMVPPEVEADAEG
jgi:hypothetical protein